MNRSESRYFATAARMDEAFLTLLAKKDFEYWEQAEVLDNNYIQKFIEIEEKYYDIYRNLNNYQNDIKEIKECEFESLQIARKWCGYCRS